MTLIFDDPTTSVQSSEMESVELFFLIMYTIEMCLKIFGMGFIFIPRSYLRDGWNILDFCIVTTSLLPYVIGSQSLNLSSLRSLRVLRPLRTISSVKELKVLVATLFASFPYLVNTIIILFFFFLIFAIAGV